MPVHETTQQPTTAPPQEVIADTSNVQLPVEPELTTTLGNEAAATATQGYEYTRQDGTVEHATNREEAIKLCPVLGKLAMKDPNAADLLLDIASIGQAKMAEKAERPKPEAPKQEPVAKAEKPAAKSTETAEKTADVDQLQRQSQGAANNAIIREQNSVETIKVAAQVRPERYLQQDEPSTLHYVAAETRILHEQQIHEAVQVTLPDKDLQPLSFVEPQLNAAEITRQTLIHEALEVERILEPVTQQSIPVQDTIKPTLTDNLLPDELHFFDPEPLAAEQEPAEWIPERVEAVPLAADVLLDYEQTKPESVFAHKIPAIAETIVGTEQIELVSWEDELDKEPLELYEDFTEALQALVTISAEQVTVATESTSELIELLASDTPESQPIPVIAITVAERLGELEVDEKEAVAPTLTDIVETMHLINVLKTEEAVPEIVETIQAELEELVTTFFEQLGIVYEAEDIEQFMTMLLRPDFQPLQPEATELNTVDLEHDGTHEAKLHFSQLAGTLADVEDEAKHILGKLVLFYTARHQMISI